MIDGYEPEVGTTVAGHRGYYLKVISLCPPPVLAVRSFCFVELGSLLEPGAHQLWSPIPPQEEVQPRPDSLLHEEVDDVQGTLILLPSFPPFPALIFAL